jgi:hypothetical protein
MKLRDTWQRRSSPQQGGEVRGRGTHGGTGAHLGNEARSGAVGYMVASETTSVGRWGLGPRGMWQHWRVPPEPTLVGSRGPRPRGTW